MFENIKNNGFLYEITDHIKIPFLSKAYIKLASRSNHSFGKYDLLDGPNHWASNENELDEYLEDTINLIKKGVSEGYLGLGTQPVTLIFENGVELEFESSEWLSMSWEGG